jgi:glycosyltransferase involved in cell wall biosynthesis/ribosomal protein S18 acetylase RimI-like enzyme
MSPIFRRSPIRVAHLTTVDLTLRFLLLEQMKRLREEGFEVLGISSPGPWVPAIRAEGFRHVPWKSATRSWSPVTDVRAFLELIAILKRERVHILHTHNPKPGILGRIAAHPAGVPIVVNTVHGLYATPEDPWPKRASVLALERLAARLSDRELYQSEEDLRWARRIGLVSRDRGVFLGNGTDVTRFNQDAVPLARRAALRAELGIPEEAVVIGTVGRLVAEKGYRELFAAARQVRTLHPEVAFLVAGDLDPAKADSIPEAEVDLARDDVTFVGWREDVRDLLALMDVFVLPSWREGVPRSAIEAAAMGRPLILTDIRGCREVARDGIEGLLVPPRDGRRLVEAILELVGDPALRDRMGKAARRRAEERFDERRVLDTVVRTYRDLLERKGMSAPRGTGEPSAEEPPVVRLIRVADAGAIARLHRRSLPDAFLPRLGDAFLRRLYRAMATDAEAVVLVAESGGRVVGFAAGVPSVRRFYRRFIVGHGIPAGVAALPRLVDPGMLRRVWETARYPASQNELPEAELLAIAVAPGHRSSGLGERLARPLLRELERRGATSVKVVVGADNEGANRFYRRLGFDRAARIELHGDAPSNVWVIPCRS